MLTLYTIVVVLLLFGLTIFIHELGHFIVAKLCGLTIETFSIGFGPALWKKVHKGITYKIGIMPFGGYVALPQMDPSFGREKDNGVDGAPKHEPISPWKKIAVSVAGASGNVLLAVLLAFIVFWVGKPSAPQERNVVIGYIDTNSVSYAEGLRLGDEILAVNSASVGNWEELMQATVFVDEVTLDVKAAENGRKQVTVPTERNWLGVRMVPGISWMNTPMVASVIPGSSAEQAGLRAKDTIVSYDGVKLHSREHLIDMVSATRDRDVAITVERDGKLIERTVRPAFDESQNRSLIGVMFNTIDMDYDQVVHPSPSSQLRGWATAIIRFLRALVTPAEAKAASQAVSGPVAILIMFWWTVQRSFILAIWFTGLLNINLAIINMLPIPVTDGGHVMFSLWEGITRRPISARVLNGVMNVFAVLIIAVFLMLTYRDVRRWIIPMFSGGQTVEESVEEGQPADRSPGGEQPSPAPAE